MPFYKAFSCAPSCLVLYRLPETPKKTLATKKCPCLPKKMEELEFAPTLENKSKKERFQFYLQKCLLLKNRKLQGDPNQKYGIKIDENISASMNF